MKTLNCKKCRNCNEENNFYELFSLGKLSYTGKFPKNENIDKLQEVKPNTWKLGDSIEIEQGPFAGYKCLFQSERGADRVTVLLNIIGSCKFKYIIL